MNKRTLLASSTFRIVIFITIAVQVTACQTPISSEQQVVKGLPTNPNAHSAMLKTDSGEGVVKQGDPRFRPIRDITSVPIAVPTGSLFDESSYAGLFLHKRQYSIGDMVQVILEEEINATKQQSLNKDKNTKVDLNPNLTAGFIQVDQNDLSIDHRQSSSFKSSSNSKQSNSLDGMVNVFVNEILSNGNLIVSGEKWIKLNQGVEYVRVSGEMRVKDINAENTVSSTKLGNALIEYSGSGELQDNQQESMVSKILSIFE